MNTRNIFLWLTATVLISLISSCSPLTPATQTEPPIIDILDIGSLENQCSTWASSGSWVRVKGQLGVGFMTVCGQDWCRIHISQSDPSAYVSFKIHVSNSPNPEPGTMRPLPISYTEQDLKVWTHDNTWVQSGFEVTVILYAYKGDTCSYWLKYISAQTSVPFSSESDSRIPTATITTSTFAPPVLSIRANIDGRSQLIIKGSTLHWHHLDYEAPGRWNMGSLPTYLNQLTWEPNWPDIPDSRNANCNCDSSVYVGIPVLASIDQVVGLNIIQSNGRVSIVQQPNANNDYTLIIEFDDRQPLGAEWYEIHLNYIVGTSN